MCAYFLKTFNYSQKSNVKCQQSTKIEESCQKDCVLESWYTTGTYTFTATNAIKSPDSNYLVNAKPFFSWYNLNWPLPQEKLRCGNTGVIPEYVQKQREHVGNHCSSLYRLRCIYKSPFRNAKPSERTTNVRTFGDG